MMRSDKVVIQNLTADLYSIMRYEKNTYKELDKELSLMESRMYKGGLMLLVFCPTLLIFSLIFEILTKNSMIGVIPLFGVIFCVMYAFYHRSRYDVVRQLHNRIQWEIVIGENNGNKEETRDIQSDD